MKKIIFIIFLSFCQVILAQDKGTVNGKLTDIEMGGEALPFANIFVKGTSIGTTSDMDGNYTILVPIGQQTIVYSFVGYSTIEKAVTIIANKTITINQEMGASEGVALDEIEIKATTSKESSSALLLEQKKAVAIKESIGADELSKKGVSDAAGAVAKISGVSKQEGSSNVYVRGLGDRYLNTTMNGLSLPSNDINKKNIDLNLFPSDVIQSVSISKAYSEKFYGDFAAGNVDITSKEYRGNGFFDVSVGSGVNTNALGKDFTRNKGAGYFGFYSRYDHNPFAVVLSHGVDPIDMGAPINLSVNISGGKSYTFKDDSRLSLFLTAGFDNDFGYVEGPAVDYTAALNKIFPSAEEYTYGTTSTLMGTALYRINPNHKLKYTSLFLNNSKEEIGYYGVNGLGFNQDTTEDDGYFVANYQFNQDLIFVNQITGDHKFEEGKQEFNWGIGYNRTNSHEPDRKRIILNNYDNLLDNDPTTNASFYQNNNFNNQRYFQNISDEEMNSRMNFTFKTSENTSFDIGYSGKYRTRNFDNIRYGYKNISTTDFPLNDVSNLNSIFNTENFINGVYETHVFNAISIENGITSTNFPGLVENDYKGELKIFAGYVAGSFNIGDKLLIKPGVRLENITQSINYNAINLRPSDPGFAEASSTFILPSLNVKYSLKEDQNLRLAFSKTMSMPEFKEIANFVYEGVNSRIGGNPDLLGGGVSGESFSKIYNLDLKYEWFMSRNELISFGVFFKQINDPINLVLAADATGTQRYFRTGEKAQVLGAELEVRKDLVLNEDEETQLSAGLNISYMDAEQDLYSSITGENSQITTQFNRNNDGLEGASDLIFNANISFTPTISEKFKPVANLVYSYSSDRIFSLGSGDVGNVIEKGVHGLDFVLKNNIGDHIEIKLSAKNLLDPSFSMVRENTLDGDVTLLDFKRGRTFGLSLKYKL